MGSVVLYVLLEPCGQLLQAQRSARAGSSSPAVLQVLSPRDQPYSCSLTSPPTAQDTQSHSVLHASRAVGIE